MFYKTSTAAQKFHLHGTGQEKMVYVVCQLFHFCYHEHFAPKHTVEAHKNQRKPVM